MNVNMINIKDDIAERLRYSRVLPDYPEPEAAEHHQFAAWCRAGLRGRFGDSGGACGHQFAARAAEEALEYELGLVAEAGDGLRNDLLVLAEVAAMARGLMGGKALWPSLGRLGNCMVPYALGITDLYPLHYGVFMPERFYFDQPLFLGLAIVPTLKSVLDEQLVPRYGVEGSSDILKAVLRGNDDYSLLFAAICQVVRRRGGVVDLDELDAAIPAWRVGEMDWAGIYPDIPGMVAYLKQLAPADFHSLITALALYRPSLLKSGLVDEYALACSRGGENAKSFIVFQEQAVEAVAAITGLDRAEAVVFCLMLRTPGQQKRLADQLVVSGLERGVALKKVHHTAGHLERYGQHLPVQAHAVAYGVAVARLSLLMERFPSEYLACSQRRLERRGEDTGRLINAFRKCRQTNSEKGESL